MNAKITELKALLKGKKVLEVQIDKGKVFLHFDDCVLEVHDYHICFIEETIPWSEAKP